MFTRTLYATGDPAKIDGAIEVLSTEGRKLLEVQPGFRGFSVFVDRELGKVLVGSWWQDEQSRQASDERLRERRQAMLAPYLATIATDNWEVAVNYRPAVAPHPGAGFRLVRLEFDPADADLLASTFENKSMPRLREMAGFEGAALFIDRARGRGTVGALYTDRAALAASRGPTAAVRGEAAATARFTTRSIEEFESAFMVHG